MDMLLLQQVNFQINTLVIHSAMLSFINSHLLQSNSKIIWGGAVDVMGTFKDTTLEYHV